ncbi:uncharacterized protein SEPMUDRAFT_148689 [Sphaerulina musiva SO2202]|uniref:Uncharacterized protein n=1 Tax=Sphaerulina musiva (strain SO2202) TaxID=692275 RepID=M3D664_SPHMS|nr:uncharacterized protein SEPMUDRAFT_148689 [Sphaerulina musiva SO2202]EMF13359.1 hypothetical protein SEPMUDRAFT_148689 [Sphaerulina musiva SO2202]
MGQAHAATDFISLLSPSPSPFPFCEKKKSVRNKKGQLHFRRGCGEQGQFHIAAASRTRCLHIHGGSVCP